MWRVWRHKNNILKNIISSNDTFSEKKLYVSQWLKKAPNDLMKWILKQGWQHRRAGATSLPVRVTSLSPLASLVLTLRKLSSTVLWSSFFNVTTLFGSMIKLPPPYNCYPEAFYSPKSTFCQGEYVWRKSNKAPLYCPGLAAVLLSN